MSPIIRQASSTDIPAIQALCMAAFSAEENALVARLATELAQEGSDGADDGIRNFVAEVDGRVIGHVAFSPLRCDAAGDWTGSILAPLAVHPEHQRNGIGSALIHTGLSALQAQGIATVIVYGDPDYYTRFGFSAEKAGSFIPPHPLQYPHGWLAITGDSMPGAQAIKVQCVPALDRPELW